VEAGISSILIANQVVGSPKIARLVAAVRKDAEVIVCVDDAQNVAELSKAAQLGNVDLHVLVDVDIGLNRCGVLPGDQAVALAQLVHDTPNLTFRGLMGYEGHTELIFDPDERRAPIEEAIDLVLETADDCREAGLPVDIVSCGSSVTYTVTAHIPGVTEIQAGGVVFMDVVYKTLGANMGNALFVQSTVISRPTPTRAVVDAGRKKMGCVYVAPGGDSSELMWTRCPVAMPQPVELPGMRLKALHAEHGILELDPSVDLRIGDRVDFVPGYVDFTVFHYRKLYGIRADKVEAAWDVVAH
jgi:D-serine deaminase-like pyridoxal phosphate-dependent protein